MQTIINDPIYISLALICAVTIIYTFIKYTLNRVIMFNEKKAQIRIIEAQCHVLPINDRLEYTKNLLSFIDMLIDLELFNSKRYEILLNDKNKKIDVDNVISEVSTNVFKSLSEDIIINGNNVLTKDYIMKYIQKKSFVAYFIYLQNNVADQVS